MCTVLLPPGGNPTAGKKNRIRSNVHNSLSSLQFLTQQLDLIKSHHTMNDRGKKNLTVMSLNKIAGESCLPGHDAV
jgi:hypothetical protein